MLIELYVQWQTGLSNGAIFELPWMTLNPDSKGTPVFNAKYFKDRDVVYKNVHRPYSMV